MISKRPLGSAEFFAQCARIAALAEANAAEKEKPGALGLLICDYRKSPAFQDLAPKTKHDYQAVFDYLRPIADTPLVRFDLPVVVRIRDKAALKGRRFGNYVKAVLSLLFKWGSQRDFLANNPASGIKDLQRKKDAPEANRSWSDQEREAVLEGSPDHMRPAIALMMFTGLGPKDALTLPRNFAKGGEIATRGAKTGAPVFWDMPCPLGPFSTKRLTISAITHCANSRGRPWSLSGINASWRTVCASGSKRKDASGRPLTLYGLRHTVAVILRETGCDERTIADALGQKTIEMARTTPRARIFAERWAGWLKTSMRNWPKEQQKLSTRTEKSVNPCHKQSTESENGQQ